MNTTSPPQNKVVFDLVFTYLNHSEVITSGDAALMQWKKNQLKDDPAYKKGVLQVRRQGAYKFQAVYEAKHYKKCEDCKGTGWHVHAVSSQFSDIPCKLCKGKGRILIS